VLLNELEVGHTGTVQGFGEKGMSHHTRYLSLGLIPGAAVKIIRVAPMGCPLQIKVGSTLLSIRRTEAEEVFVEAD